ncbi:hypothetical protein ACJRPK_12770 [Aquimarina sp. 2-A2]|uniref:hypothetical protein n=1 Tax=Aquimarina sp. 2-A2 TaxID=3382644 RepID=UPI00387F2D0A
MEELFSVLFRQTIFIIEILAAFVGLKMYARSNNKMIKLFALFLLFIVIVESIGHYVYLVDKGYMDFLVNTRFVRNYWLYNISTPISFVFYIQFFIYFIKSKKVKSIANIIVYVYGILALVNLLVTDVFFFSLSVFSYAVGSCLLFLLIIYYFYEILNDDTILNFKQSFPFYVAIGVLVHHLLMAPLFIFSKYYIELDNPFFVLTYEIVLVVTNLFMYSCFIKAFLVHARNQELNKVES